MELSAPSRPSRKAFAPLALKSGLTAKDAKKAATDAKKAGLSPRLSSTPDSHFYSTALPLTNSGYVYRSETADGTRIEREWQMNTPANRQAFNYYVKTEYVSPRSANGNYEQTAVKTYRYDQNGNVTHTTEYPWVAYSAVHNTSDQPTWITPSATPVRVTENTYYSRHLS